MQTIVIVKKISTLVLFALVAASAARAEEKGGFGFELAIAGEGYFNPTVRAVKVASIVPQSPAAAQSIAAGDEIIQVENTEVAGRKASELKPLIQKQPGESLHLKLKRRNGEIYSVTLVAARKPG
jgi:C-terminal processing protease CtpA/Prc